MTATALIFDRRRVEIAAPRRPNAPATPALVDRPAVAAAQPAVWPPLTADFGAYREQAHRLRTQAMRGALIGAWRMLSR
jgi:hypothetical protein